MAEIHFDITGDNSNLVSQLHGTQKEVRETAKVISELGKNYGNLDTAEKQINALNDVINNNKETIEGAKAKIQELTKAWIEAKNAGDVFATNSASRNIQQQKQLIQELEQENTRFGQALNVVTQSQEKSNKENENASGLLVKLMGGQQKYNAILSALPPGLKSAISGFNGMTKAAWAFIATPLGAIIGALVAVFMTLKTALAGNAEGQERLARISGTVSGIMNQLKSVVINLGNALFTAFDKARPVIDKVANALKKVAQAVGIDTTKAEEAKDNIAETSKLYERRNKLAMDRAKWQEKEAELDLKIARAQDKMYSAGTDKERADAANSVAALNAQKYNQQIKFAKEEYEIQKRLNELAPSTQQDLQEEYRLKARITELEAQKVSATRRANRVTTSTEQKQMHFEEQTQNELNDIILRNQQERISLEEEGTRKQILQIRQNYEKRDEELRKQEEKWKRQNREAGIEGLDENGLLKDQAKALEDARKLNEETEAKARKDLLEKNEDEYLKTYGTYKEKQLAITREYDKKIAATDDEYEKKSLGRKRDNELARLEDQYSEFYKKLAKDRSEWLVGDTVALLKMAEDDLAKLGDGNGDENTVERIQRLKEEIKNLKGELSEAFTPAGILKQLLAPDTEGGGKSLAERIQSLRDAWKAMTTEQKWKTVGGYVAKIGSGLSSAAASMREIAELSGDTGLANTADQLSAVAQNFSAAGQGAAQGGWIGAIVGGVTDIIGQTINAFTESAKAEELAKINARDWAQAIEELGIQVNKIDFDSIFGTKAISLGQARLKEALDTMDLYEKRLGELDAYYNGRIQKFARFSPAAQEALRKGNTGLKNMRVKTKDYSGWANFWGKKDKYASLGDIAPELWDEKGEFNTAAAKEFLKVNTQINEEQRKQIENLVELKDKYDEAMKAVDDSISAYFGDIASNLTDVIWDSVMNGADAWQGFEEAGAEAISRIGKSLIQEMLISEYLEQYRDQLREAYKADNIADTQSQLRDIVGSIFDGMEEMFSAGSAVAEEYKAWADKRGFDLTGASGTSATQGSFQTISEATGRALEGRFAALQISNDVIASNVMLISTMMQSMSMLSGESNGFLSDIRGFHVLESGYLEDIARQTKPILTMSTAIEEIRRNTQNL